jgi:hypothetical protein
MPYDRFLLLQIAADQVVPSSSPDLAAMGFLTLGRRFLGVTHDIIDDRIDVVTRGTLGLTVACARETIMRSTASSKAAPRQWCLALWSETKSCPLW